MAGLLLVVLGGCAGEAIVLVADPDGHVGKAEVTTSGGKQLLEKPNDLTRVSGSSRPPSAVTTADPGFINTTFGEALAVEPQPKESFTLYFETGTTIPIEDPQPLIAAIVATVKRRSTISVSISGHTDATGPDELNNVLSLDRAKAVQALLLQQGVKPGLITVSSHGKRNPAIPRPDGVAEPRNRRVVVIVH